MITSLHTTQPTHPGAAMASRRSRWDTSHRHDRLPEDWQLIRAEVKARANGRCQAKQHANGCNGIGTDCDHIIPGDNNSLENLRWLSNACHKAKTVRETAARNSWYRKTRLHPVEENPGSIQPGVGGVPPRARWINRRIAPPIMRASSCSFFARIPDFPSLWCSPFYGPFPWLAGASRECARLCIP